MKLLHLSDTHLAAGGKLHETGVNATETLRGLLSDLEPVRNIDAVLVTGDVADDGSVEAYERARDLIGAFARERGVPTIFSTGNTDDRTGFATVLGSGHLDAEGHDHASASFDSPGGERAAVSVLNGLRLITLDTLVPGEPHGHLGAGQLDWLRSVLAETAAKGTALAFHHPPILHPSAVQRPPTLLNPEDLAEAIAGTDVRVILCGHYHLQLAGRLGEAMVWVGPGVVNRRDLACGDETVRYVRGAAATLADLTDLRAPVFHTMPGRDPRAGEILFEMGGEELREALRRLGAEG
ncbi:metallophosphoesterase [Glycomyces buryatensis]|uniref:Metallophosphoesterase n=1 Tax=Glycomyces buryatensis TaxID=2570927 RepID=A0A4S8QM34_9ACTN|nr:metallophosphoesterase [Glycomyces buryatensis]THV42469.1 metallophosphoesterase [Glycomyces buryatensis]